MYAYAGKENKIHQAVASEAMSNLLKLLAPFTPHIAEELWHQAGFEGSVHQQSWPIVDKEALRVEEMELPIQINGKVRDRITVSVDSTVENIQEMVMQQAHVQELIGDKKIVKCIIIPKKIINIVIK